MDFTQNGPQPKKDPRLEPFMLGLELKAGGRTPIQVAVGRYKNWITLHRKPERMTQAQLQEEFEFLLSAHQLLNPGAYAPFDRELFLASRKQYPRWMKANPGLTPPPYLPEQAKILSQKANWTLK